MKLSTASLSLYSNIQVPIELSFHLIECTFSVALKDRDRDTLHVLAKDYCIHSAGGNKGLRVQASAAVNNTSYVLNIG